MKISIITVCKNAAETIEKTILSVLAQTYQDLEYIIVDGASRDGTKELINRHKDGIYKIISESDRGIYHAMNKGIDLASGDFIYFINADDFLINNTVITDVVDFLKKYADCDVAYGNIQVRHRFGNTSLHRPPKPDKMLEEMVCGALPHQATFTKRSILIEMGRFNETYKISADYEWFLRLTQHQNLNIYYMPVTVASYSACGMSANVEKSLPEVYEIQNRFSTYQTDDWIKKRIHAYQQQIIELRARELKWAENFNPSGTEPIDKNLLNQLEQAYEKIAAMESSKFWKLRK